MGNTFPYTPTMEKVYAIAGKEFREYQGYVVELVKS